MILLVDDRPENILSLKSILDLHGYTSDSVLSGEEALKKVLKKNYALIILDVQMPGMDGFEVAEILGSNNATKEIPIIFLSAVNTDKKFITQGYISGAVDYIVKPIDPDILIMKVKTFFRIYEQKRELQNMQQSLQQEVAFRKKAQLQMQDKAKQLNEILEAIPQLAFTASPTGVIEFVNSHWLEYAKSISFYPETHPDDPEINELLKTILSVAKKQQKEVRLKVQNADKYRYHLLKMVPLKEHDEIIKWVGTLTDIQEQKLAIQRKDEFLTIASHELKTPLTSIKAYVQLLNTMIPEEDKSAKFINRTLSQVNKLDFLINDLLDLSRIEARKLNFNLEEITFKPFVISVTEMLQQIYPETNFTLNLKDDGWVMANSLRLEQVILNFVSNAIKYSPDNKEIHITSTVTENNQWHFAVKDFGMGIALENQHTIFGKFYRISDTLSHIQGLGIGLFICSEILKIHQAKYGVKSKLGEGSEFFFSLPLINKALL